MSFCDLSDMYALSTWVLGIRIRQIPDAHMHTTTIISNLSIANLENNGSWCGVSISIKGQYKKLTFLGNAYF